MHVVWRCHSGKSPTRHDSHDTCCTVLRDAHKPGKISELYAVATDEVQANVETCRGPCSATPTQHIKIKITNIPKVRDRLMWSPDVFLSSSFRVRGLGHPMVAPLMVIGESENSRAQINIHASPCKSKKENPIPKAETLKSKDRVPTCIRRPNLT